MSNSEKEEETIFSGFLDDEQKTKVEQVKKEELKHYFPLINETNTLFKNTDIHSIKYQIDYLYFKKKYLEIIKIILKNLFNLNNLDLSNEINRKQFIKEFLKINYPITLKREILECLIRSLFKLNDFNNLILLLNDLENCLNFKKSQKASLFLFFWEIKAKCYLQLYLLNKNNLNLICQAIKLIQKTIHCKSSLLYFLIEDYKKGTLLEDMDFRNTFIDTLYQSKIRCSNLWKLLSTCYFELETLQQVNTENYRSKRCEYFSKSLTQINSFYKSQLNNIPYQKEFISFQEFKEELTILENENYLKEYLLPNEFHDKLDLEFTKIYLLNNKTIHFILSEQRGKEMSDNEEHLLINNDDKDGDNPKTFNVNLL
ncbi:hypothetical protein ABK040_012149 [Willaertia magna]